MREYFRKIFFPLPSDQEKQGFRPNTYIKIIRAVSRFVIKVLRLNGENRFSNELIQQLDPKIGIDVPDGRKIYFRTGHGRLFWRAKTLLTEEPKIIEWIDSFGPNDVFYDIGANVGNYSIYAASKKIKTVSFEPEPLNVSLLFENIILNKVQDYCTIIPLGVGSADTHIDLYLKDISKGDALHSIGKPSYMLDSTVGQTKIGVVCVMLDSIVGQFNIQKPTKLKIDVDGNELQILQGSLETLKYVDEIYIEFDFGFSEHVEADKLLKKAGFELAWSEDIDRKWNQNVNRIYRKI